MNDYEIALQCLKKLSPRRIDEYDSWVKVGMILKQVGLPCSSWDSWSRSSQKYKPGDCENKWQSFNGSSLGELSLGSLIQWVREDGQNIDYKEKQDGYSLDWDSEIGPKTQIIPGASENWQTDDLIKYLKTLFHDDETVNYVIDSHEAEGRFSPRGRGVNKNCGQLVNEIDANRKDISFALGDWNPQAGAWIRINPMSGEGCRNADVTDYRHVLVESDELPIDEQLSMIRTLNLPCAAVVHSGGKSVHAIVKIQAGTSINLYKERVQFLFSVLEKYGFKIDMQCKNPSRLSRIPGVTRNGKKQYLISLNDGLPSWESWEKEIRGELYEYDIISPSRMENVNVDDQSDSILGNRFLCKQGSWLIVALSGIGKSVACIQGACCFAVGRDFFGIVPAKKLKQIIIQAENNFLDLVEPFQSIVAKMELSPQEKEDLNKNLLILSEDSQAGPRFAPFLEHVCKKYSPDIIWIDPLMAYIGGDISRQEVCSSFLRNQINPIIHKYNIGLIVLHHTGKPPKNLEKQLQGHELAYLGIGSSELTNWARAVSTITQDASGDGVYTFEHSKREGRSGAKKQTFLKHSESGIYWEETDNPGEPKETRGRPQKYADMGFEYMPPKSHSRDHAQSELLQFIQENIFLQTKEEIDINKADGIRSCLMKTNTIIYNKSIKLWTGKYYIGEQTQI
jgi:hypothetical protein